MENKRDIWTQIKIVFIPYLLVAFSTIILYNLFRWTFDIHFKLLPLKEDLLNFWLPFSIPWIPILIWLKRPIRILKIKGKQDNGFFLYQFIMVSAICVPIIISQNFIEKAAFNLERVQSVSSIKNFQSGKYYTFEEFDIEKDKSVHYTTGRASGRNNEDLTFYLYLSCPFKKGKSTIWYGVEYSKRVSNYSNDEIKNDKYKRFLEKSSRDFEAYDFKNLNYFERLGYSDDQDGFLNAVKDAYPEINTQEHHFLIPKNDVFNDRLGNSFPWIFRSFGIGSIIIILMVIIPKIESKEYSDFLSNRRPKDDDFRDTMKFLNPFGKYRTAAILINLNLIVFAIMVFSGISVVSPTAGELLEIGANRRTEVIDGEYWRLFSSLFIHGGLMHLCMNLIGLGLCAHLLEPIVKHFRLFCFYIICGLCASLTSIFWHENTISVGASGAIFGLFGLLFALNIFKVYPDVIRGLIWKLIGLYAGVSLLFGLLGGIDNSAHLGGLISGSILGSIMILFNFKKFKKQVDNY